MSRKQELYQDITSYLKSRRTEHSLIVVICPENYKTWLARVISDALLREDYRNAFTILFDQIGIWYEYKSEDYVSLEVAITDFKREGVFEACMHVEGLFPFSPFTGPDALPLDPSVHRPYSFVFFAYNVNWNKLGPEVEIIASFDENRLQLGVNGEIIQNGEVVSQIDISNPKRQGKFDLLRQLMQWKNKPGNKDLLMPERELRTKEATKSWKDIYTKLNSSQLKNTKYSVVRSGKGYKLIKS